MLIIARLHETVMPGIYPTEGVTAMRIRRWLSTVADLPADTICRWPVVTMSGRERLLVENHRGLCEYAADRIRIRSTCGMLCIVGEGMVLEELSGEDLCITGTLWRVGFEVAHET